MAILYNDAVNRMHIDGAGTRLQRDTLGLCDTGKASSRASVGPIRKEGPRRNIQLMLHRPGAAGGFDDGFGEHSQLDASAFWIALSVLPFFAFHSMRPLAERPRTTPAAVDGEEKR